MRIGVTGTIPDGKEAPSDELSKHKERLYYDILSTRVVEI
jgi:hypothetical protein